MVLYLVVDEPFYDSGFGSQLLLMVVLCLLHRNQALWTMKLHLKANPDNRRSWPFYHSRGFLPSEPGTFPPEEVTEFFGANGALELIEEDDPGLVWLELPNLKAFNLFSTTKTPKNPNSYLLFVANPEHCLNGCGVIKDDMINAQFPGELTASQINWCGDGLPLLGCASVFDITDNKVISASACIVQWPHRVKLFTNRTLGSSPIEMCLAWIGRNVNARIWRNRVTLLPTSVSVPLWNMHSLFQKYLQASAYADPAFEDRKNAIFHPEFDDLQFMKYAGKVFDYVLANPDIFKKPYIIIFGENLDMDWSCFIAVNAYAITHDRDQQCEPGSEVCGFIHYDPSANDLRRCL